MHGILTSMYKRTLGNRLPENSFFLFGPRQVGKSTLLKKEKADLTIDLLDPELQLAYNKTPNLLRQQVEEIKSSATIVIDEVQRVPKLLDIIHSLMEQKPKLKFMLCGSSSRRKSFVSNNASFNT
jgi:predicted AAA+ superfamily ATPase